MYGRFSLAGSSGGRSKVVHVTPLWLEISRVPPDMGIQKELFLERIIAATRKIPTIPKVLA